MVTDVQAYQTELNKFIAFIAKSMNREDKKIKVLITGATGLIGSYLGDVLLNYNLNIADTFQITLMTRNQKKVLTRFKAYPGQYTIYEHDMREALDTSTSWDLIFHLASNADPGMYEKEPLETIQTNILGTNHLIDYAKKNKKTRIIFTSTMEVYGEGEGAAYREQDYARLDFNSIRAGYPESKRLSELMYRSACKEYQIDCVIARLGYIYGPTMTQRDNKVVAEFLKKAAAKENLVLNSRGTQLRTYCYVADVVQALLLLWKKGEQAAVYNVANPSSKVTVYELAKKIAEYANVKLTVTGTEPVSNNHAKDAVLDSEKIMKLGWNPMVSMDEGIKNTIQILRGEGYE